MGIRYQVDPALGLVRTTWAGAVTAAELERHLRTMLADPAARACARSLTDLRGATLAFDGAELQSVVGRAVLPALDGLRWRAALVVGDAVQVGVSNQWRVYAAEVETGVFTDEARALAWLQAT